MFFVCGGQVCGRFCCGCLFSLRHRHLLGLGSCRVHQLRGRHLPGQHGFLKLHKLYRGQVRCHFDCFKLGELHELSRGNLFGCGCELLHQLRRGHLPDKLRINSLLVMRSRLLLGGGRKCLYDLCCGYLPGQRRLYELLYLRCGQVYKRGAHHLFQLHRWQILGCWCGRLFQLRGWHLSSRNWSCQLCELHRGKVFNCR